MAWKQHRVGHGRAMPGLEMLFKEARHFHDVGVGVVNDAPAGVRHCSSPVRLLLRELIMTPDISYAVRGLLEARRSGLQLAPPFALPDRNAVYAIQDGVARATGPVAG